MKSMTDREISTVRPIGGLDPQTVYSALFREC